MKKGNSNIGLVHEGCAADRLIKFQVENPVINLKPGNCVKMGFPVEPGEPHGILEWMWLEVNKANNTRQKGRGRLVNYPTISPYKMEDVFEFEYDEICEITEKIEE